EYYTDTKHGTIKYLNNFIEQDHRHVKRRFIKSSGFQSIRHASRTIKGIETIHAICKQKRSHIPDFSFSTYKELQRLFRTA
ncbi:TPA: DDE-type integrase/transposase/recombinase, partial [Bacillus cereus]